MGNVPFEEQNIPEDNCGICFVEGGKKRGELDCCNHVFCFGCTMKWLEVESRCPLCRQRCFKVKHMEMHTASSGVSGREIQSFCIPHRDQIQEGEEAAEEESSSEEDQDNTIFTFNSETSVVCTRCEEFEDEEGTLLYCEEFDATVHTNCISLSPSGKWVCPMCGEENSLSPEECFWPLHELLELM